MSEGEKKGFGRKIRFAVGLLVLVFLGGILLMIKTKMIQFFLVASGSMEPTLLIGDRVFVDSQRYPDRFDIVTLHDPEHPDDLPLVKRVVGIGGDEIRIKSGILYINGEEQYNRHIKGNHINWGDVRVKVPSGYFFLLGDNRNNSYDSLNFGPVPESDITGVLTYILWPASRWGKVDNFED